MRFNAFLAGLIASSVLLSAPTRAEFPPELGVVEGQVVWVDFWASWCTPCRRSFPWMNEMHAKYADSGLQIIGVNVDKERALADEFLAETPADFSVVFDPESALAMKYGVQAMPSSFVMDATGKIIATHYGFKLANREDYEEAIRQALASRHTQTAGRSDESD